MDTIEDFSTPIPQMRHPSVLSHQPSPTRLYSTYPSPSRSDSGVHVRSRASDTLQPLSLISPPVARREAHPLSTEFLSSPSAPSMDASSSLRRSLGHSGLFLDLEPHYDMKPSFDWPSRAFQDSECFSVPATVSPRALQRDRTQAPSENLSSDSSLPSAKNLSETLSYDEVELSQTPEMISREETASTADNESEFMVDPSTIYEPCHLAIAPDERAHGPASGVATMTAAEPPSMSIDPDLTQVRIKQEDEPSIFNFQDFSPSGQDFNQIYSPIKTEAEGTKRTRTPRENAKYICPICDKPFSRTFNYHTHLDTHKPDRQRPYVCRQRNCGKGFFRPTDLKRHDQSVSLF